jgi:hypothetical protein
MQRCPQCGMASPEQAKFCRNCGYTFAPVLSGQNIPAQPVFPPPGNVPSFIPYGSNQAQTPYSSPQPFQQQRFQVPALPPISASPRKSKRRTLVFVWVAIIAVIILALGGLFVMFSANTRPHLTIIPEQPVPGQSITLLGERFPAGSPIVVVFDAQPLLLSLHGGGLLFLQTSLVPLSFAEPQGVLYRTLVASDGTFTIKMRIPATAKAGSKLTIIAQVTGANPQQVKPVEYQLTIAS